jgi:hypothetical protein
MTREQAIAAALKYGLQAEVIYYIDVLNMSPEDALYEWDI